MLPGTRVGQQYEDRDTGLTIEVQQVGPIRAQIKVIDRGTVRKHARRRGYRLWQVLDMDIKYLHRFFKVREDANSSEAISSGRLDFRSQKFG
ncbi:MAG TPA: hypothetical protein VHV10_04435 [Ktedonobacteraceae bacterium]|nr:hypothetical protein [Ktedonobacteraceae bacterium]